MEPAALGETPAASGSGKIEPHDLGRDPRSLGVGRDGNYVLGVGRDMLIRLALSGEVSVDANSLTLGIPNIDTRQLLYIIFI